ncbi:MAG TPA: hypothetical protein VFB66_10315 [Tepidisphaeraceae bacterium]|nr:hypothetical protein [Tepidisphaeraceae bacterium]
MRQPLPIRWSLRGITAPCVTVIVMIVGCGCASGGKPAAAAAGARAATAVEFRALAAGAADNYVTAVAQATDQLRRTTKRPEVAEWAWETKVATAVASYSNATGPNDAVCLLDMVLYATLKRHALEEHWVPTLLHEEGAPLVEVYRRAEDDVWKAAAQGLSREQLAQLRSLIDRWRREHPGQYYIGLVRFADMAAAMKVTAASEEAKGPGSVFGLLMIDPLAGLDPVTLELRNYRALTERIMYMTARLPIVLGWQVEFLANRVTATPQVERFVGSTEQFVTLLKDYPAALTKERQAALAQVHELVKGERQAAVAHVQEQVKGERQAAIEQLAKAVAGEREAISRDVTAQQSAVRQIVADVQRLVETTAAATTTVNAEAGKTIARTEEAGRRSMMLGFQLIVGGSVLILIGIAGVLLLYRLASRRWLGPVPGGST